LKNPSSLNRKGRKRTRRTGVANLNSFQLPPETYSWLSTNANIIAPGIAEAQVHLPVSSGVLFFF